MRILKAMLLVGSTAALLGACGGTASATVLCHTNTTPCGSIVGAGTTVESELVAGTLWTLKAGFATIECEESELDFKTENAGSATSTYNATTITFRMGKCKTCTVVVLRKGGIELHYIQSSMNTTITSYAMETTVSCVGTSCVYGTGNGVDVGTKTGGNPARLHINGSLPKISGGFLCANPAAWTAEYTVTAPNPLYGAES